MRIRGSGNGPSPSAPRGARDRAILASPRRDSRDDGAVRRSLLMETAAFCCHGVEIRLADDTGAGLCRRLREALAPEFAVASRPEPVVVSYAVTANGHQGHRVTRDGTEMV